MNKHLLALLLFLYVTCWAALALAQQNDDDIDTEAGSVEQQVLEDAAETGDDATGDEVEPGEAAPPDENADENENQDGNGQATGSSGPRFIPSEQISEDLGVSFPANI